MTRSPKTSPRKAEANRRNASRSTGPRTPRGKAWSRLNALKHGILASQAVISTIEGGEERKMFDATVAGLADDFQPVGTYEQLLVQEIAACFWRKRRLLMFENRAAFDAIELPAAEIVERGTHQPIPWKEPLYTEGDQMTTAEQIYKHAGLDAVTLPNEADTMRVIRYEAAINRTRERAVASLREMKKARRGMAASRAQIAPAVDRIAARRNAIGTQAKLLSPWFSIRVWKQFREEQEAASEAGHTELRDLMEGEFGENGQTKPKTLSVDEIRRSLYRAINGKEMPEESDATPAAPEKAPDQDPDQPKSS
jgi:hypothetical protein